MKVIETIENIDFILPDEKSVEFINDKALIKLVGLAKSGHHFNEEQDRRLSGEEFKDLLCSFTDDKNLLYALVNKYQNVVLDTEVYALIDRDFKEVELSVDEDVYFSDFVVDMFKIDRALCTKSIKRVSNNDFLIVDNIGYFHIRLDGNSIIGCKLLSFYFKETNIPNVLKSEHQIYNLDTMEISRDYDYIGDFQRFIKPNGDTYNAALASKKITVEDYVDEMPMTVNSYLFFFVDDKGVIVSPINSSYTNEVIANFHDDTFDEIVKLEQEKILKGIHANSEVDYVKKFMMKKSD